MTSDAGMDVHFRKVGARIRAARKRAKMTQTDLGSVTGRERSTVCKWERGPNRPTVVDLMRAAGALGVSPSWLAGFDDTAPKLTPLPPKPAVKPEPALPSWVLTAVEAYAPRCPVCTIVHQHAKGDSNV